MQFPWKRFWLERGGPVSFLDQGFMYDPEALGGRDINPGLATLTIKEGKSCTVLLGEPGMGKSSEIQLLAKQVASADVLLFIDLRSFGEESRLISSVFGGQKLLNWKEGQETLHLFFDSLDECLLRIDTVATVLADELEKLRGYKSRLRIYIASRTAPWPRFLETNLKELFGETFVEILEIAPLRKEDVRIAAEQSGIATSEVFIQAVVSKNVVALAMKPVTLKFLVAIWKKRDSFPTNLPDLYREGCRILCDEDNAARRASPLLQVSSADRYTIATRIAALTQIGNRFAIWTGRSTEDVPDEDVPLHKLCGGKLQGIRITEDAIRNTLDTGLFSARGSERIGWAHLTYSEFMAGVFCNEQRLSLSQLRAFFFHPSGTGLIPQLAEVAGWTALDNRLLFSAVALEDPEALLNAGLEGASDLQKEAVVEGLLRQCRTGKHLYFNWSRSAVYSKLKHPRLSVQLNAELSRSQSNLQVQYMVLSIAQACKEVQLCEYAGRIALDKAQKRELRQLCVTVISHLGSRVQRKALKPLLGRGKSQTQLKAYVIDALWPSIFSTEQIFALLPAWESRMDKLGSFLHGRFIPALEKSDLEPALHWAQQSKEVRGVHQSLVMAILRLAWTHIEDPKVGFLFADTVASKLGVYGWFAANSRDRDFMELLNGDGTRRRILLKALLSRLVDADRSVLHYPMLLVDSKDVVWLLEQFGILTQAEQGVAADCIRLALDCNSTEQMTALWWNCQQFPSLAGTCGSFLRPISLDADWVNYERGALERKERERPVLDPPPAQRVLNALRVSESENVDAWLNVVEHMTLEADSTKYEEDHKASVLDMPGWQNSSEDVRQRITQAAQRFIELSTFFASRLPPDGGIPWGVSGAVQALWLCLRRDHTFVQTDPSRAEKCAPSVIRFHAWDKESRLVQQELLRHIAANSQHIINAALVEEICQNNDHHGYYMAREIVQTVWTPDLGKELLQQLKDGRFKPSVTKILLAHLLELGTVAATEFASSTMTADSNSLKDEHVRAVAVGWMHGEPKSGWNSVWPLMRQDEEFGTYMVHNLSGSLQEPASFLSVIDVEELADFYVWMIGRYPYPPDEADVDSGPSPVNYQHHLRDAALEQIKQRRSFEAVMAIQRLMNTFPQYSWLRFHLDQADLFARAGTWEPFTVEELRKVITNPNSRLIGSERDLLLVICESLARLQQRLRGETPTVRFLWNMHDNVVHPKGEEDLSDYIKDHLVSDIGAHGVVVNREVQIRRLNPGGHPGQRTDIQVSAVPGADSSRWPVSVIIEVKGCWHIELRTAMRTQLRDRYLTENATRSGLYVVGYYAARAWDDNDPRKQRCGRIGIDELQVELEGQATELSESVQLKVVLLNCSLE